MSELKNKEYTHIKAVETQMKWFRLYSIGTILIIILFTAVFSL